MCKIAKREDWDTEPMPEKNDTFELHRHFTEEQMERLRQGNIPKAMEDKWFLYYEDGKLYAHRSWTGFCIFIIEFNEATDVHAVTVNRNEEQYRSKDVQHDLARLNDLLNWWCMPKYDYYHQWIFEVVSALEKKQEES